MRHSAPWWILLLCLIAIGQVGNVALRTYAQDHPRVYDTLTVLDMMDFVWGSGAANPDNQFTWTYNRALQEPRPIWHHLLFWGEAGSKHDYIYRPHFDHDFPPIFDEGVI